MTIKELAAQTGVSPATVSLALANDPRVADATRRRIQRLAKKVGYVPSHLGRALQASKSRLIGYLLSDVTGSFFNEIVQGVVQRAEEDGYSVIVAISNGSGPREAKHLEVFREKQVDGVMSSVSGRGSETRKELRAIETSGTPVVFCSQLSFDRRMPHVATDNEGGGLQAAEHLYELGHRRLGFCFGPAYNWTDERYQGVLSAAGESRAPKPEMLDDVGALRKRLRGRNRPTGIVAASDFHAIEVKRAAEAIGLGVPRDLSIVGFDDLWFCGLQELNLTTIAQQKRELGRASADALLKRIKGEKVKRMRLPTSLVVRGSTAAPPA